MIKVLIKIDKHIVFKIDVQMRKSNRYLTKNDAVDYF